MKAAALAAALAACQWQPTPAPTVEVLPREEFFDAMAEYMRYARPRRDSRRTLLDIVDASEAPAPYVGNRVGVKGFTDLRRNRVVMRADTFSADWLCHEFGHLVNGPGHEWLR